MKRPCKCEPAPASQGKQKILKETEGEGLALWALDRSQSLFYFVPREKIIAVNK